MRLDRFLHQRPGAATGDPNDIESIGYKLESHSIQILGNIVTISRQATIEEVNLNWKKVMNSINLVGFKIRTLKLPLLQTVKALKTFLLSKISYTAGTTTCPPAYVKAITNLVISTINAAGHNFSKESIFSQQNGLNFPEIDVFCKALITSNFIKARRAKNFWTNKIEECFFNNNPELIMVHRAQGTTEMIINDLGYFYRKKVQGYNTNLPVFSERFKLLSDRRQFLGPPPPSHPWVENKTAHWRDLRLETCLNKNKTELEELLGFTISGITFFNFSNNLRIVKRKIDAEESRDPFISTRKMNAKKIRTFLTIKKTLKCPLLEYFKKKVWIKCARFPLRINTLR